MPKFKRSLVIHTEADTPKEPPRITVSKPDFKFDRTGIILGKGRHALVELVLSNGKLCTLK